LVSSRVKMSQPSKAVDSAAPKRRACDECRSRKLACSKEPNSCERCIREGIACHYSVQKPMGRPRKRQFAEVDPTAPEPNFQDSSLLPFLTDDFMYDDINVLEPYFATVEAPSAEKTSLPTPLPSSRTEDGRVVYHFGDKDIFDGLDNMNFGATAPSVENIPALSNPSTDSTSSPSPPASDQCSCLASMYLALASLQQLPTNITSALSVTRKATLAASEAIWCPTCGSIATRMTSPPIESFQNLMLLGTLLPILANCYARLIEMIDNETDAAVKSGAMKTFDFEAYGGATQSIHESRVACTSGQHLTGQEALLKPGEWRTLVRALLRWDLYGHEEPGFKHMGLKDLIHEIETRQRDRHSMIDTEINAGNFAPQGHFHTAVSQSMCNDAEYPGGPRHYNCLEILKLARTAIDSLVIA